MPDKKALIVGFVSSLIIFITVFFCSIYLLEDPLLNEFSFFSKLTIYISEIYPLPFSQENALDAAETEMLKLLDPFSYRIESKEYDFMIEETSGNYGGVGISIIPRDTALIIVSVNEGGPSHRNGIRSGDNIIGVNGQKITEANIESIANQIRGPEGTSIPLTIRKMVTGEIVEVDLEREQIKLIHIPYSGMTKQKIAYIRINDFESGTAEDLREAVDSLEKENPHGYILDMTGNPGGFLHEAVDAADIFLDPGLLVVGVDGRSRWNESKYESTGDAITSKPIAILIDGATASAAEILTGALRGANRCITIGDTTYGKGLVQSLFELPNGDALRLTTARYYFADGRYLNPPDSEITFSGLVPDLCFNEDIERRFRQLIQATFLLYDFTEAHWDFLANLPDDFSYPDTVISLLAQFAENSGIVYSSETSAAISSFLMFQAYESEKTRLPFKELLDFSKQIDSQAFARYSDYVEYQLRMIVAERKDGEKEVYHNVIVSGRADIKFAEEILLDSNMYNLLLTETAEK